MHPHRHFLGVPPRPATPRDLPWMARRIACPAPWPHYVVPGSHFLDPVYYQQLPPWPFPRSPWAFESETRAPGTGLIRGPGQPPCGCRHG